MHTSVNSLTLVRRMFLAESLAMVLFVVGCNKKNEIPAPPKNLPSVTAPTPAAAAPTPKPVYVYGGDHYRDIFIPVGASSSYMGEAVFDPQKLALKGIIFSPRYKSAVLVVSGSGVYFVRDDRIFDVMGKTVKGFSAKVMTDRVIVMNESDNRFEIKMKTDDQEATTL